MAHHSDTEQDLGIIPPDANYEKASKAVYKGMWLLAFVTLIEVGVSLFGKGHLGFDPGETTVVVGIIGFLLIALSLYKAYFIVYEFMHMGHEVPSLRMTVLMPMLLLVWAIIAFFYEGSAWKENRTNVLDKNAIEIEQTITPKLKTKVLEKKKDAHGSHDGHGH